MNSSSLSRVGGGERCGFVSGSQILLKKNFLGSAVPFTLNRGTYTPWLKQLEWSRYRSGHRLAVYARIKKGQKHEYPWPDDIDPNMKSGHLSYLSHFKPLTEKPKPVTLAFEKPLVDLEKKIIDVRKMAEETGLDFSEQINLLENKYQQALKDLYTHLTPIQRLNIARHPNRPTFLDHVLNITEKWVELHGDRAGYDDPAIVTGIGSIDGKSYLFIGHQKGRNTKENIQRNFAMPTPHGYRKALRMMRYADHHGFPIITFIDTPGAFADLKSEELGQGEAIAHNLREMFGLKVPIITIVIGEGGSGGALAIGCANKLFMLENAVFYVASPEACAAILWKSSQAAPKAAEKLKITATELCRFKIADGIIPEPLGGAHVDPTWTSQQIKVMISKAMEELAQMDTDALLSHRHLKFRALGGFLEGADVEPEKKRNMKKKEANVTKLTADLELEIDNLKKAASKAKGQSSGPGITKEAIDKLRLDVDKEITNAFISMGLQEKLETLKMELSKVQSKSDSPALNPALKDKADKLFQEFKLNLSRPGSFLSLKQKLEKLAEVNKLVEQKEKAEKLRKEINEKLGGQVKERMEILKMARDKVAKGEKLSEDLVKEVDKVKEELQEMLKSVNLEVVGSSKKNAPSAPPGLEEKLEKADEVIKTEIDKAVELGGLKGKIEELKAEVARGSNKEKINELSKEIREQIAAVVDPAELKKKIASVTGFSQQDATDTLPQQAGFVAD
ncbi:acetyl-CoA carboxylase carboxyl transferase subunit alpha protein [Dioscorea alata]|uniref:Acetyl-CoA carboxylase carboxyl transferase subunit alpha protein n=6 Tax=Dioscorea alata TaxID=55571 RepID=A0ACB7V840_DIOAL|nr:acetyl-CoA carboxylase carboxyl transferase subunit alpha protein [Dioscorea alata]KAH7669487.1 acetyl-CoA carboxylase carboxyl transferase subunit alpha protein [Dioscorea alata]KAH7669488.1 acetyl-CoA carboxylase carboxyl transferase subunit alpha protein [Dioscorea alata]KAH7669489.1 acetyl-CoA carboxylase carboxyl transferase subunit alpha protein [Dioscorea alata]KAH7669490.1 acetyl-CoA carboxylase carboxyl transferase subunit alpha protein [Dioscorea alata]